MALTNKLTAIGNAIRAKNGETALYTLDEMPQKIAAIEGGGGSGSSILPSEYEEVEFLQVDGSQYIITDYYPTRNTNIISRYYSSSGGMYVYGVRNSGDTASFSFMKAGDTTTTLINCRIGSGIVQYSTIIDYADSSLKSRPNSVGTNSIYLRIIDVFSSTAKVDKIGEVIPEEFTSALSLYIFNCNQNGVATSDGFVGNLYRLTIKENDVIVRDFIPCYRKSDSKPGLYDIVNKQFYTNAGSGEFSFPEYTIQEVNNETANF